MQIKFDFTTLVSELEYIRHVSHCFTSRSRLTTSASKETRRQGCTKRTPPRWSAGTSSLNAIANGQSSGQLRISSARNCPGQPSLLRWMSWRSMASLTVASSFVAFLHLAPLLFQLLTGSRVARPPLAEAPIRPPQRYTRTQAGGAFPLPCLAPLPSPAALRKGDSCRAEVVPRCVGGLEGYHHPFRARGIRQRAPAEAAAGLLLSLQRSQDDHGSPADRHLRAERPPPSAAESPVPAVCCCRRGPWRRAPFQPIVPRVGCA